MVPRTKYGFKTLREMYSSLSVEDLDLELRNLRISETAIHDFNRESDDDIALEVIVSLIQERRVDAYLKSA